MVVEGTEHKVPANCQLAPGPWAPGARNLAPLGGSRLAYATKQSRRTLYDALRLVLFVIATSTRYKSKSPFSSPTID